VLKRHFERLLDLRAVIGVGHFGLVEVDTRGQELATVEVRFTRLIGGLRCGADDGERVGRDRR
jgi:hypothetical protein